jgi:hypothetical protein
MGAAAHSGLHLAKKMMVLKPTWVRARMMANLTASASGVIWETPG